MFCRWRGAAYEPHERVPKHFAPVSKVWLDGSRTENLPRRKEPPSDIRPNVENVVHLVSSAPATSKRLIDDADLSVGASSGEAPPKLVVLSSVTVSSRVPHVEYVETIRTRGTLRAVHRLGGSAF